MNLYIQRHTNVEKKVKKESNKINKKVAKHLLNALSIIENDSESIMQSQRKLQTIFYNMYTLVHKDVIGFGEDMIYDNIDWESKIYDVVPKENDDIILKLFGSTLISQHSLKNWLLKMAYKDVEKLVSIMRTATIENLQKNKVKKMVYGQYKSSLYNIQKLVDAIAFSSIFLVRDKMMEINGVELMQWSSVMDKGTTEGCILRDEAIYFVKTKEPYKHNIPWLPPGIYHWGCRSFMIPYKE